MEIVAPHGRPGRPGLLHRLSVPRRKVEAVDSTRRRVRAAGHFDGAARENDYVALHSCGGGKLVQQQWPKGRRMQTSKYIREVEPASLVKVR